MTAGPRPRRGADPAPKKIIKKYLAGSGPKGAGEEEEIVN